jgi:outer membrane protein OmpA-like peptidoglycan-associated protein
MNSTMKLPHFVGFLLILSALVVRGTAQEVRLNPETGQREVLQYHLGAYGALSINFHTAGFGALPGYPSCCPEYNDGTSVGPAIGGLLEIPMARNWRMQVRLGYSTMTGELTDRRVIGNEPVLADGPVPIGSRRDIEVDYVLNASLPMVVFEPAVAFKVLDLFWLYAGARGGLLLGKSFSQSETLVSPDGYVFAENGSTVRNSVTDDIPDAQSIQLHAAVGLGYELHVARDIMLAPEVRYFLPLTKVASVDWSVQSFQLGASLRYSIYSPVDPTIIYDTIYVRDTVIVEGSSDSEEKTTLVDSDSDEERRREGDYEYRTVTITEKYNRSIPRAFNPTINLARGRVGPGGETLGLDIVQIRETDVVESYPLLPQVFFDEGSADMATTRMQMLERENVRDFRTMDLARDQFDVYHNILNIIGERMRSNPSTKISLTGSVNNVGVEKNNRALAQNRAEAVRTYLVDVWGIEKNRITVASRLLPEKPANTESEDGKEENRRVDIATNDVLLLETVEFRDRDRSVNPKAIVFSPTIIGGDDITGWSIKVSQRGSVLFEEEGAGLPGKVTWQTEGERRPKLEDSLNTVFVVRNNRGSKKELKESIPVDLITTQKAKSTEDGGKIIERYSLIVFDYNSAKLNEANQRTMAVVRARVQPESKVRIMGYADRSGDLEYNKKLALRRCEEAKRVLGVPEEQVSVEPVGSDRLIYDNETPEGRSYCRTVQIEIETPLRD